MDAPLQLRSENEVRRTQVVDSIRDENLVVVVGTGVSIGSLDHTVGIPEVVSWQGLLRNGLARCHHLGLISDKTLISDKARDIVEAEIEEGSVEFLIGAAQKITGWLAKREGEKGYWLEETIGQLRFSKPALIEAIAGLGGVLATLNYDSLLTQVTGRKAYHWGELAVVNELLRKKQVREFILHLHGYWEAPESLILDWKSYDTISNNEKTHQHLRDFTISRTLLFIGCGDTFMDPNLQTWLRWSKSAMSGEKHRHYILCRAGDQQNLYRKLLEYGHLAPLVYGETYEELEPFLVRLAHDADLATPAAAPAVSPSVAPNVVPDLVGIPSKAFRLSDQWPR